jgi:hypothetical protein
MFNDARWGAFPLGVGLTGTAGDVTNPEVRYSAVNYTVPLTTGTALAHCFSPFAPNDGVSHSPFIMQPDLGEAPANFFDFTKYLDNNLYTGWFVAGTDYRVITVASGLWAGGDHIQIAHTYDTGASIKSRQYVNGLQTGTSSTLVTTSTAGASSRIRLGIARVPDTGAASAWGPAVYQVIVWDRVLSPHELLWFKNEPYAMLMPVVRRRVFVPAAEPSLMGAMSL